MRYQVVVLFLLLVLLLSPASGQVSVPWTFTRGPLAGHVQCVVRNTAGALFLGTDASGIYRSTDGVSWKHSSSGLLEMDVRFLAPEPDGHVLALTYLAPSPATSHSPANDAVRCCLYRSNTAGSAWVLVDTVTASDLLVDQQGYIWIQDYEEGAGIWYDRSTNGGTTWSGCVPPYSGHPEAGKLAMDSSGALYLGMSDQAGTLTTYKSTTNGRSWTVLLAGMKFSETVITQGGMLLAVTSAGELVRTNLNGLNLVYLDAAFTGRSLVIMENGTVYAVRGGSVIRSTDSGSSWTEVLPASTGAAAMYCPDGTSVYATSSSARLLRTSSTLKTWTDVSDDLKNTFVASLLCTKSGAVYAGTQAGIWKASDVLGPWVCKVGGSRGQFTPYYVWSMARGSGSLIAAAKEMVAFRLGGANYERSWGSVTHTPDDFISVFSGRTGYSAPYPSPAATDAAMLPYATVIGTGDTIYLAGSPKSGGEFAKYYIGEYTALKGPLDNKTVYALTRNSQDTLFAGTESSGVFRSATRGTTWLATSGGLGDLHVRALATDSTGVVYAGTETGLYLSTNNGTVWSAASGFPSTRVQCIATNSKGFVYVATTDYVWVSTSQGSPPWHRLNLGLPTADIASIAIGPDDDVYAGTWGEGVYHRPAWRSAPTTPLLISPANLATGIGPNPTMRWHTVSGASTYHLQVATSSLFATPVFDDSTITDTSRTITLPAAGNYYWRVCAKNEAGTSAYGTPWRFAALVTSLEADPDVPGTFVLDQNRPNPFNPSTIIRYGLPTRTHVRVVVYSTLGQELAVLADNDQPAGYHEVTFAAGRFASGVYICRMEAGSAVLVRKMALIR